MKPLPKYNDGAISVAADEIWARVVGHADAYEVSNYGRVRSLPRTLPDGRRWRRRLMAPQVVAGGHIAVNLTHPTTTRLVHQLVLESFVGARPEGTESLHWNDIPSDNRLSNLRWGTRSENLHDAVRNGHHHAARKTHCNYGHRFAHPNLVVSDLRTGRRRCLACKRTRLALFNRGLPFDPKAADAAYVKIMNQEES